MAITITLDAEQLDLLNACRAARFKADNVAAGIKSPAAVASTPEAIAANKLLGHFVDSISQLVFDNDETTSQAPLFVTLSAPDTADPDGAARTLYEHRYAKEGRDFALTDMRVAHDANAGWTLSGDGFYFVLPERGPDVMIENLDIRTQGPTFGEKQHNFERRLPKLLREKAAWELARRAQRTQKPSEPTA